MTQKNTIYIGNAFIYYGKNNIPNPNKFAIPTLNVLELVTPIFNSKEI